MKRSCICNEIYKVTYAECESGTSYLCKQLDDSFTPNYVLNNQQISRDQAVQTVAQMLANASYPLITGLTQLGSQAVNRAIALARKSRGVIDTGNEISVATSSMVRTGQVIATIGEIADRADRLLLVECCVEQTHPRLFIKLLQSDTKPDWSSIAESAYFEHSTAMQFSFNIESKNVESELMILQSLLRQSPISDGVATDNKRLQLLLDWMLSGNYVAILTGNVSESCMDCVTTFCKALNQHVKAVTLPLQVQANCIGAENKLAAATGFPRAVDFSRGYARSFGGSFCTNAILSNGESDLLVSFDPHLAMTAPTELPTITFILPGHDADLPDQGEIDRPTPSLQITGLNSLGDAFHRVDHLSFEVKNPSSEINTIGSFLAEVLENVT